MGVFGSGTFLFFQFFRTFQWYFVSTDLQTAVWLTMQVLAYSQPVIMVIGVVILVQQIRQHFASSTPTIPASSPFQKKTW